MPGMPYLEVEVHSIQGRFALCTNSLGRPMKVRADVRRGNGPLPRPDERWILDRTLGQWTFAACIVQRPPEVTGSTDAIPALESLLAALEEMGLIDRSTTATRIRANTTHTH